MRPLDPDLIRRSGAVRSAVAGTLVTGIVAAAASVVLASTAAAIVARAFLEQQTLADLRPQLITFAGAWFVRATASAAQDVWVRRAGVKAVAALRSELARAYAHATLVPADAFTLLSRGIDALDIYIARYLPQLVLAVLVPLGLGLVVLEADWRSAIVFLVTIPLIPLFMALIGWFTERSIGRQWAAVGRITTVIADLFDGLADLVIFDRAKAQASLIRRLGGEAATATMKLLRISFLSSLALELIATIAVAMIALGIGLRLSDGTFDLETGLMVLILAPDVYLPIRQVGTQFHAAVEGMEAWAHAKPMLAAVRQRNASAPEIRSLDLCGLTTGHGSPLHDPITMRLERGTLTTIVGPSGAGKSTLLRTIAGLADPIDGTVEIEGVNVHTLRDEEWFPHVGYLPQDPWLGHGTVREALARGAGGDDAARRAALASVGLGELALESRIDDLGRGVSIGQRRRIALARYRLRGCRILLLDEPTAAVDADSEARILALLDLWRREGAIVAVVAHRPALELASDHVVRIP